MFGDPADFPPSLLYNHTMLVYSKEDMTKYAAVPSIPFEDTDVLVDGGRYKDKRGVVLTVTALSPDSPEAKYGFPFRSDRHVYYRPNGATMEENNKIWPDDIVEKVTAEIIPFVSRG